MSRLSNNYDKVKNVLVKYLLLKYFNNKSNFLYVNKWYSVCTFIEQIVQPNTWIWYPVKMSTRSVPTSDVTRMYGKSVQLVIEGSQHWTALCFAKLLTFAVAMLFLMGGLGCPSMILL